MKRSSHHEPAVFNETNYDLNLAFDRNYIGDVQKQKPHKNSSLQSIPRRILAIGKPEHEMKPNNTLEILHIELKNSTEKRLRLSSKLSKKYRLLQY